jgi:hypothetical protein
LEVHPKDADRPLALGVEPGRQRKKRRLPGAIQPEQDGEFAGLDRERSPAQGLPLAKAVSEPFDGESGNSHGKSLTAAKQHLRATDRQQPI